MAHGGAGRLAPSEELPGRRRALLAAAEAAARILQDGGDALDAVIAAIVMLEDDPLFNAGYGSYLTVAGTVEMDAAVATARPRARRADARNGFELKVGGVVMVRRVRNPILLARAVMELTPHVLMGGAGAERLARQAGLRLHRPAAMIAPRARERWLALTRGKRGASANHGTVGAVALDVSGNLAAATSTGGVTLQLPGRIGDSAIAGAGLAASPYGAASATGEGEAILKATLCHDALERMRRKPAHEAAALAVARLRAMTSGEAGIITIDPRGNCGCTHNASVMEVAIFNPAEGVRHQFAPRLAGC